MAAKVYERDEQALFESAVRPAIEAGDVDWRGEVGTRERDRLMAGALATLMLGGWPEPFGLVAIESMATGTPVIARRAGALTETIEHGVTGFIVDDVDEAALAIEKIRELDRHVIRERALERFSPQRMADFPDVPTFAEIGHPGATMMPWWGFVAPAGTPQPIVARLTQELETITKDEAVRERLKVTFVQIDFAGPQEFARRLESETALYGDIIRAANIKLGQ